MFDVKEMNVHELRALLDAGKKVRLIDVRSDDEFNQGIIEGGEFFPLHTIPLKMNELANKDDETLVIYCRSGNRSAQACMYLKQNADIEAINLQGGIISWYQSGNAVIAPPVAA